MLVQGGIEARPGTEKRCSHNLQNGPVKTWTAVFVTIHIFDQHRDNLCGIVLRIYLYFVEGK